MKKDRNIVSKLEELLSEEFRGHPSFHFTVTANVLVKKRQSDPGQMKVFFKHLAAHFIFSSIFLGAALSNTTFLFRLLSQIGRATFNICDTVATNCLHPAVSPVQFRKLRKEKDGREINKFFSILTVDGSGVTFSSFRVL